MEYQAITVTDLNKYIKEKIAGDENLANVLVKGEISNFKLHYTGHMYFTLKDENSLIKCIMFKTYTPHLKFTPKDGMKVMAFGTVSVFERDGVYQLYCKAMQEDGMGSLYTAYEELKAKLEKEGYFDSSHKKKIPFMPKSIGVLTSNTGAVIRDIINVSTRRNPNVYLKLLPVPVQGEGAAEKIAAGIEFMNEKKLADVIILARGGGSLEDLWPFNEEIVAKAIYNSKLPVISAVGHETDFTIADFVADLRAPTPSAAAELAVYEYSEVKEQILNCESLLRRAINQKLLNERMHLEHSRLKLQTLHPRQKLNEKRQRTVDAENTLRSLMERHLTKEKHRLALCAERMKGLSPLEKLSQGYSYVCNVQGQNIKKTDQVREGDLLQIYVTDGQIETYVTGTVKLEGERGQSSHKQ